MSSKGWWHDAEIYQLAEFCCSFPVNVCPKLAEKECSAMVQKADKECSAMVQKADKECSAMVQKADKECSAMVPSFSRRRVSSESADE